MENKKFIPSNDTNKAGSMKPSTNEPPKDKKTAGNNQWVSTGATPGKDNRERRDGPGGENGKKTGQQPK
jgi:hypothetical protein